jgi:hypothetical protein
VKPKIQSNGQKQEQWSGSLSSKIKSKRWIVGEERGLGILIGIQPPYQSQLMCFQLYQVMELNISFTWNSL